MPFSVFPEFQLIMMIKCMYVFEVYIYDFWSSNGFLLPGIMVFPSQEFFHPMRDVVIVVEGHPSSRSSFLS